MKTKYTSEFFKWWRAEVQPKAVIKCTSGRLRQSGGKNLVKDLNLTTMKVLKFRKNFFKSTPISGTSRTLFHSLGFIVLLFICMNPLLVNGQLRVITGKIKHIKIIC